MNLTRRAFLAAGGALAASTLTSSPLLAALQSKATAPPDLRDWSDVRRQFALAPGWLHFSSFYIASHPKPVRDAIEDFRRTLDANPFLTVEHGMFESESENVQRSVRQDIAPHLGAQPDEIALVTNTTTGLALVYHGLPLRAGDELLCTEHDHYSHQESIRFAAERAGASVRRMALYEQPERATADDIVARVRAGLRPATRVLGVTWVHSGTGVRLPIRAIADVVQEANRSRAERDRVLLVVDGVHGLGVLDEDVAALGCDFFCAGTHKWMFAPRGTGIVWGHAESWARLKPMIPTFSSLPEFEGWLRNESSTQPTTAAVMTPGGFQAYEHQWAMGAAFRFHRQIGRRRVAERIRALNEQCKAGLAGMANVTLRTPRDAAISAGLTTFEVKGVTPEDVVKRLLERKIVASTSPYRVVYARLAPSLVNDESEVEAALRAVRAIAGG